MLFGPSCILRSPEPRAVCNPAVIRPTLAEIARRDLTPLEPCMMNLNKDRDQTISDFGEQWTRHTENPDYYGSVELFADIIQPFLTLEDISEQVRRYRFRDRPDCSHDARRGRQFGNGDRAQPGL